MSRMTDDALLYTQKTGENAERERRAGELVVYASTIRMAGLRAIESEVRRRAFDEVKHIVLDLRMKVLSTGHRFAAYQTVIDVIEHLAKEG